MESGIGWETPDTIFLILSEVEGRTAGMQPLEPLTD